MGHNYIGTEHIVLALLEVENGSGLLADAGITPAAFEAQLIDLLATFQTVSDD